MSNKVLFEDVQKKIFLFPQEKQDLHRDSGSIKSKTRTKSLIFKSNVCHSLYGIFLYIDSFCPPLQMNEHPNMRHLQDSLSMLAC